MRPLPWPYFILLLSCFGMLSMPADFPQKVQEAWASYQHQRHSAPIVCGARGACIKNPSSG